MFSKLIKIFFRYSALSLLLFIIITISTKLKVAAIDDSGSVRINLDIDGGSYGHELLWHKPYSGSSDSFAGPIIEGAVGYIGNPTNGNFRCFNISDGSLVWETYIGKSDSTPILDNQGSYIYIYASVYNSGANNGLYKLDKSTGEILSTSHVCSSAQGLAQNDSLIFDGCFNSGRLYAFNKSDLSTAWSYNTGAFYVPTTPLYYNNSVTFGTYLSANVFFQLNATNGTLNWVKGDINDDGVGSWDVQPSVENGIIYMGGEGGYNARKGGIAAFSADTGDIIWQRDDMNGYYSQMAIYDGKLWAGSNANALNSFNLEDGSTYCSHQFTPNTEIYQGPSIVDGIAFVGSLDKNMYAVSTEDCSLLWKYETSGAIYSPPAIDKGTLYFNSDDGNLYAFDLGVGTGSWSNIGYDETGKSYCSDCLTELQNVEVSCSQTNGAVIRCTAKNNYEHSISKLYLSLEDEEVFGDWYDSAGSLLASDTNTLSLTETIVADGSTFIDFIEDFDLNYPSHDQTIYDTTPTFSWIEKTTGETVVKYQLYVDDELSIDNISPDVTSVTLENELSLGDHSWYVKAIDDLDGETNSASTNNFTIEEEPENGATIVEEIESDTSEESSGVNEVSAIINKGHISDVKTEIEPKLKDLLRGESSSNSIEDEEKSDKGNDYIWVFIVIPVAVLSSYFFWIRPVYFSKHIGSIKR